MMNAKQNECINDIDVVFVSSRNENLYAVSDGHMYLKFSDIIIILQESLMEIQVLPIWNTRSVRCKLQK